MTSSKPSPQQHKPVYDFKWAEKQEKHFYCQYSRGHWIFWKMTGTSSKYATNLLRYNQEKWERFKKIIKSIEKEDEILGRPVPMTEEYIKSFRKDVMPALLTKLGMYDAPTPEDVSLYWR